MTTTPFADPEQMRRVKAQMLLDQLRAAGISPEELVALGATGTLPGARSYNRKLWIPDLTKGATYPPS